MKKFVCIVLALVLSCGILSGCGTDETSLQKEESSGTVSENISQPVSSSNNGKNFGVTAESFIKTYNDLAQESGAESLPDSIENEYSFSDGSTLKFVHDLQNADYLQTVSYCMDLSEHSIIDYDPVIERIMRILGDGYILDGVEKMDLGMWKNVVGSKDYQPAGKAYTIRYIYSLNGTGEFILTVDPEQLTSGEKNSDSDASPLVTGYFNKTLSEFVAEYNAAMTRKGGALIDITKPAESSPDRVAFFLEDENELSIMMLGLKKEGSVDRICNFMYMFPCDENTPDEKYFENLNEIYKIFHNGENFPHEIKKELNFERTDDDDLGTYNDIINGIAYTYHISDGKGVYFMQAFALADILNQKP